MWSCSLELKVCLGVQITKQAITQLCVLGKRKNNVLCSNRGRMLNPTMKLTGGSPEKAVCKVRAIG